MHQTLTRTAKELSWLFATQMGADRKQNKDLYALIDRGNFNLVIAFDVSTSSPATTEMAKFFFEIVIQELNSIEQSHLTENIVDHILQLGFKETKAKYKIGKASLLVIGTFNSGESVFCFHTGDIRLGNWKKDKSINWLTNVHTGANPLGEPFVQSMLKDENRKIVTRCFNLQKTFLLDYKKVTEVDCRLIIATDGFWAECYNEKQQAIIEGSEFSVQDDLSVLVLTWDRDDKLPCNQNGLLIL
ncbi:hypothetical protein AB7X09_07085 [Providencia rettgeri]